MIKTLMRSLAAVFATLVVLGGQASAATTPAALNAAYYKGSGQYDVVFKTTPGLTVQLYVNDKNPVKTVANKKDWATFHRVKLTDKAKISFAKVLKNKKGQTFGWPINYVRYVRVADNHATFTANNPAAAATTSQAVTTLPAPASTSSSSNTGIGDTNVSNNNTYTNSAGTAVHSPANSTDGSVPAGATARCNDGTYSFSQTHSGTCSHHGGVASWL